jgi:hypothetical protein
MKKLKLQNIKKKLRTKTDFLSLSETLTTSDKAELMDFLKTLPESEMKEFTIQEREILKTSKNSQESFQSCTQFISFFNKSSNELEFDKAQFAITTKLVCHKLTMELRRQKNISRCISSSNKILNPAPSQVTSTMTGIER